MVEIGRRAAAALGVHPPEDAADPPAVEASGGSGTTAAKATAIYNLISDIAGGLEYSGLEDLSDRYRSVTGS